MNGAPYLLIDAGNSRIKWALVNTHGATIANGAFEHERAGAHLRDAAKTLAQASNGAGGPRADAASLRRARQTSGARPADVDEHFAATAVSPRSLSPEETWSALPAPSSAWISNVAGAAAQDHIEQLIDARWPGLPRNTVRAQASQCGVVNCYEMPQGLGSDRWSGMIGARAAFPGEHLLIATFGTATTLEALRADGAFIGGLIAPGWSLMMQSLGSHTAQLPTLDAAAARTALDQTQSLFASNTAAALSAGCLLAQASLIERAWHDLRAQWQADVRLVLGGGAANEIASALRVPHTRHDSLVLSGLALVAQTSAAPSSTRLPD